MIINTSFDLGELVYLVTDKESEKRIITVIEIRAGGTIGYYLALGSDGSWHYEQEIVKEKEYKTD